VQTITRRSCRVARSLAPFANVPAANRVRAAVTRIVRARANAQELIADAFGESSATAAALSRRIDRLSAADAFGVRAAAADLHSLATWMNAVAESIETEEQTAGELRPHLAVIISECEKFSELAFAM
jgi:hypothetical protein